MLFFRPTPHIKLVLVSTLGVADRYIFIPFRGNILFIPSMLYNGIKIFKRTIIIIIMMMYVKGNAHKEMALSPLYHYPNDP